MHSTEQPRPTIMVVDDDEFALENMALSLGDAGATVLSASSAYQALQIVDREYCHVVITDVKMPGMDGITFVEKVQKLHPQTKFIIVTGYADDDAVIRALRLGVKEFLKKPYRNTELLIAVQKLLEQHNLEDENRRLVDRLAHENVRMKAEIDQLVPESTKEIVGEHPSLLQALRIAQRVAEFGVNAMIIGENGTGKEKIAETIRTSGPRKDSPFITVNCAAISATLFESEMFGYEKGAFTGALKERSGLFEMAHKGILFLDEVTEIPTSMQAKLLRVLETGIIRRVGGNRDIAVDVQVISATNRESKKAIEDGVLRMDLYHRLATIEINLAPLRDRASDIPSLVAFFIDRFSQLYRVEKPVISAEALQRLVVYDWPGNVRQLSNIMKQWALFGESVALANLTSTSVDASSTSVPTVMRYDFVRGTIDEIEDAKFELVRTLMNRYNGNKSAVARHVGLSYPGLHKLLKRIGDAG